MLVVEFPDCSTVPVYVNAELSVSELEPHNATLPEVPDPLTFELKALQFDAVNKPLLLADAVGKLNVCVFPLLEIAKSVPLVPVENVCVPPVWPLREVMPVTGSVTVFPLDIDRSEPDNDSVCISLVADKSPVLAMVVPVIEMPVPAV